MMKRPLALMLSAVFLLGLLSACTPEEASPTPAAAPTTTPNALEETAQERAALLEELELTLPEGISPGEYDLYFRFIDYGGYPLLDAQGEICGGVGIYANTSVETVFEAAGSLQSVRYLGNHASFDDMAPADGEVPCMTGVYSCDVLDEDSGEFLGTEAQWCALWSTEGAETVYALFLDQDRFDQETFLSTVSSAVFGEGCFS